MKPIDLLKYFFIVFRCIEILGRGCLNEQAMADLVKIMIATMTEHFERQAERNKKRNDEDYDEGI